jgi:hypothetical protein
MVTGPLQEIANWKVEAKLEDNDRYFYHTDETQELCLGHKSYLIGRRGVGKTAIGAYILNIVQHDVFSEKATFKNFPFEILYSLKDLQYSSTRQYISVWKYIIYLGICRLMLRNDKVAPEVRGLLRQIFPSDPNFHVNSIIRNINNSEFSAKVLSVGKRLRIRRDNSYPPKDWRNCLRIIEEIIKNYADNSKYYIVIDELDDDYHNVAFQRESIFQDDIQYFLLLSGLFRAVQDIRYDFEKPRYNIYPIVCLRDDIYGLLRDDDKTKWDDFKINLRWDYRDLKNLLAFRISRVFYEYAKPQPFPFEWNRIFKSTRITVGKQDVEFTNAIKGASHSNFEYIISYSQMRPRDIIKFLQTCAQIELKRNSNAQVIGIRTAYRATLDYSKYLVSDIIGESRPAIPDIEEVLKMISNGHNSVFTYYQLYETYNNHIKSGRININNRNFDTLLRLLYYFNIIGCRRYGKVIFSYLDQDIDMDCPFLVHRGLRKALNLELHNDIDDDTGEYIFLKDMDKGCSQDSIKNEPRNKKDDNLNGVFENITKKIKNLFNKK